MVKFIISRSTLTKETIELVVKQSISNGYLDMSMHFITNYNFPEQTLLKFIRRSEIDNQFEIFKKLITFKKKINHSDANELFINAVHNDSDSFACFLINNYKITQESLFKAMETSCIYSKISIMKLVLEQNPKINLTTYNSFLLLSAKSTEGFEAFKYLINIKKLDINILFNEINQMYKINKSKELTIDNIIYQNDNPFLGSLNKDVVSWAFAYKDSLSLKECLEEKLDSRIEEILPLTNRIKL